MAAAINDLLYTLEHRFLPRTFFDPKYDLLTSLYEDPQLLWHIFSDLCKEEGLDNPFTQADFRVSVRRSGEIWRGALLVFPIPEQDALCFEEYLFTDGIPAHSGCYTLEFESADGGNDPDARGMLCAWTAAGEHINCGSRVLSAGSDYFAEAFQLHKQRLGLPE